MKISLKKWLDAWGYTDVPDALHLSGETLPPTHPYRSEIAGLLDPQGDFRAHAVFDVDGVPTVCFVSQEGNSPADRDALLRAIRERAWNQNLVSIVLTVQDSCAIAVPAAIPEAEPLTLRFQEATHFGAFSSADVQSGDVFSRHPDWFASENRVDRMLLGNLDAIVEALAGEGLDKTNAQLLMAQIMFVSYLEHRGIVGDSYRQKHKLKTLFDLVAANERNDIVRLLERLKVDFNGDVLEPVGAKTVWTDLSQKAFVLLHSFLARVDLRSGQQDFWRYDFRYIPVELISGIYESFLSSEKRAVGAYYTPRNLAMLAVEQAFRGSTDILRERIYDGACGSGILLTTAFRRMLSHAEALSGHQLDFPARVELLKRSIYGSDLNKSACRVTAFSLYLSVLENLDPADLTRLTEQGRCKLPKLAGANIYSGDEGDFFSEKNPLAASGQFTLFLSNPPWVEPDGEVEISADTWATKSGALIPRRQLCAAFMWRALDAISPQGRFCFILPVSVMAASTSQKFVRAWTQECKVETVINFGDIRKLLFDNAKQPTLLVIAKPRADQGDELLVNETFSYWTPKADVSLAFGRLTMHGADHHQIATKHLQRDNAVLTNFYWGTPFDVALISRLRMRGVIEHTLDRDGWRTSKGFHKLDRHVEKENLVSVAPLRAHRYLDARSFATHGPLLNESILQDFPDDIDEVPNLTDDLMQCFRGPRIVFKDGMNSDREICAGFSRTSFSFNSSTAVIVGPEKDADVLLFLSAYLHSDLVRYLMLLSAYQVSFERERVALRDIKRLPFVHPDDHHEPTQAWSIVKQVHDLASQFQDNEGLQAPNAIEHWKRNVEELIAQYFGLTHNERQRVAEVVTEVLPSVQPSSIAGLLTPLQQRVQDKHLRGYVDTLVAELKAWRDAMQGTGNFGVEVSANSAQRCGALGILRLDLVSGEGYIRTIDSDDAVIALIRYMRSQQLLPTRLVGDMYLAADVVVQAGHSLYLIKPLVKRLWLMGEAVRDAERIVRYVQRSQTA